MAETKTISLNALIAASLIIASMIVPGLFDEPKYFCETRPELGLLECDGFSKYVAPKGKCLNAKLDGVSIGNKICRSGWLNVTNDLVLEGDKIPTNFEPDPEYLLCVAPIYGGCKASE